MKTARIGRVLCLLCLILFIGQTSIWANVEESEEFSFELFTFAEEPYGLLETRFISSDIPPPRNIDLREKPKAQTPEVQIKHYTAYRSDVPKLGNTLFDASLISFAALNMADYLSTKQALKLEGLYEANPVMQPFVKNDLTFAAVKLGVTVGNYFLFKSLYKKNKTLAWILSLTTNFAMSYVVSHNLRLINYARGLQ